MKSKEINLLLFALRFLKSNLDEELLELIIEDGYFESESELESLINKIENFTPRK